MMWIKLLDYQISDYFVILVMYKYIDFVKFLANAEYDKTKDFEILINFLSAIFSPTE